MRSSFIWDSCSKNNPKKNSLEEYNHIKYGSEWKVIPKRIRWLGWTVNGMQTATRKSCQNVMWKGKPYLCEISSVSKVKTGVWSIFDNSYKPQFYRLKKSLQKSPMYKRSNVRWQFVVMSMASFTTWWSFFA